MKQVKQNLLIAFGAVLLSVVSLVAAPVVSDADLYRDLRHYTAHGGNCVSFSSDTEIVSCTANFFVEYTGEFFINGLDVTVGLHGHNNNNTSFSQPYPGFDVQISLDGNVLGTTRLDTDNTTVRSGALSVAASAFSSGTHTVRFTWLNDFCPGCSGGSGDANLEIDNIFFVNASDQDLNDTSAIGSPGPIPEPGSYALLLLAVGVLACCRKK